MTEANEEHGTIILGMDELDTTVSLGEMMGGEDPTGNREALITQLMTDPVVIQMELEAQDWALDSACIDGDYESPHFRFLVNAFAVYLDRGGVVEAEGYLPAVALAVLRLRKQADEAAAAETPKAEGSGDQH